MKILFVSSGNNYEHINPTIKNQGDSLRKIGIEVKHFTIEGRGLFGYLKNLIPLRSRINNYKPDIIHSHFLNVGIITSLISSRPKILSLMGSDVKRNSLCRIFITLLGRVIWDSIIVKSQEMKNMINIKSSHVIPNGIDISQFKPLNKKNSAKKLGWNCETNNILFAGNTQRPEKNFKLFKQAVKQLSEVHVDTHILENVVNKDVPYYMNASDVVVLTSLWEGSPNVIKEAMACNRPIVCTDVGDVEWLFGNLTGHFICKFDALDVSHNIQKAINFAIREKNTTGRERIKELLLDENSVAIKLRNIYQEVLSHKKPL